MSVGIYSALSGMKIKELELDMVAHNIANANTTGFKEESAAFKAVLAKHQDQGTSMARTPFSIAGERTINFETGPIIQTNNQFDLALQGNGFFEVQTSRGNSYTRNGAFTLNSNGELVTMNGDHVQGDQGIIQVGEGQQVQISPSGKITVDGEDKGDLKIVSFDDLKKLTSIGGGYYQAQEGADPKVGQNFTILQGKLEQSNTNIMSGLVKLIEITREYQAYQKIVSSQSQMESQSATSLGKIG